jgi:hypothetical protein
VALAACGGEDHAVTAQADAAEPSERPSAISADCTPPPDCLPIVSLINLDVCCSDTLRCGFDLTPIAAIAPMYPELASVVDVDPEAPCWPRSSAFFELPTAAAERISVEGGDDVLITPDCPARLFAATELSGCCLPDDGCGYATQMARFTFHELSGQSDPSTFTQPECLSATQLNAELRDGGLAAWAYVPESKGHCDFASLDAQLK